MRQKCKSVNRANSGDDTHWYIQLVDKSMNELYKILIFLPREFPIAPPKITVTQKLRHPWVNMQTLEVFHHDLTSWSSRSDLGATVVEILREFTTSKPAIVGESNTQQVTSTILPQSGNILEMVSMPVIPGDFPELKSLKDAELELLDSDSAVFDGFITNLILVTKYRQMKEELLHDNVDEASSLIKLHDSVLSAQSLLETHTQDLSLLQKNVDALVVERDSLMKKFTPKTLLDDLSKLVDSTESETNSILSNFTLTEDSKAALLQQRIMHHKAKALTELISIHGTSKLSTSPSMRR